MWNPINWVKKAWAYSRMVVVNVIGLLVLLVPELVNYSLGVNWESVVGQKWSVVIGAILAGLNVVLRYYTVAPVGASVNAQQAAVNVVAEVKEEEQKLVAMGADPSKVGG